VPVTRDRPGQSGRPTDDDLLGQAVDDRSRVESNDAGNRSSSIGDDDVGSLAGRFDPPAEVGSELCDGNVYEPDVDFSEPQFTQMARSGVGGYRVPWLSDW
jgi:hypothetical protein